MPVGRMGVLLANCRRKTGETQGELALRAGIGQGYVSKIENATAPLIGRDIIESLAAATGIAMELFEEASLQSPTSDWSPGIEVEPGRVLTIRARTGEAGTPLLIDENVLNILRGLAGVQQSKK